MIKAVLFDYGGVLSEGGGIGSIRHMWAGALGIKDEAVQDISRITHELLMKGEVSDEAFLQELHSYHPEAKQPTIEAMLEHTNIFSSSKPVYDLAKRLQQHSVKTGILSNMYTFSAGALKERGLFDGFNVVLLSCEEHLMKPDPDFYKLAVKKLQVPSKEILFIDDRAEMLATAERLGMQTILAKTAAQIVHDTEQKVRAQNHVEV
ncbi:MAG TPA: HAD family phosphatase [Patescibacteria group bacterium]|nr:HAD family phosphatase [Patescibacteria group bacterium]